MREIGQRFIDDLSGGQLQKVLARVKKDDTLDLEFREKAVNVYYRGGSILHVVERALGVYLLRFDTGYLGKDPMCPPDERYETFPDCDAWLERLPHLKNGMDEFFTTTKGNREREFQQQLVRENNSDGIGKGSDYFICDIEWSEEGAAKLARFDAVAVHWPSTPVDRKNAADRRLALLELKWGDNALDGESGLRDHVAQVNALGGPGLAKVKQDALFAFNLKQRLGLVPGCQKELQGFSDEKPQFIFVLANHDPAKAVLRREVLQLKEMPSASEILFARANYFGTSLHQERLMTVDQFLAELEKDLVGRE